MGDENSTFENDYSCQNQYTGNGSRKGQGTGLGIVSLVCGICAILFICLSFVYNRIEADKQAEDSVQIEDQIQTEDSVQTEDQIRAVVVGASGISPILGIIAVVLGIVQIVKNEKKGMAIVGIVCGAVGLALYIVSFAI